MIPAGTDPLLAAQQEIAAARTTLDTLYRTASILDQRVQAEQVEAVIDRLRLVTINLNEVQVERARLRAQRRGSGHVW
jgi:hypothetical protein